MIPSKLLLYLIILLYVAPSKIFLSEAIWIAPIGGIALLTSIKERFNLSVVGGILLRNRLLFFYLLWSTFSILWTIKFSNTAQRVLLFYVSIYFASFICYRFRLEEVLRVLRNVGLLVVLLNALLYFVSRDFVFNQHGLFQGFYDGKSHSAKLFSLLFFLQIVFIFFYTRSLKKIIFNGLTAMLFLFFLWVSGGVGQNISTSTAIATFISLVSIGLFFKTKRVKIVVSSVFLIIGSCFFFFLISNIFGILELLGKDPTITGRTYIWGAALQGIYESPIVGYGLDAFWKDGYGLNASKIFTLVNNSHNSYIDIILSSGFVGFFLFLLFLLSKYIVLLVDFFTNSSKFSIFALSYLILICINSLTSNFFTPEKRISFLFFLIVVFYVNFSRSKELV